MTDRSIRNRIWDGYIECALWADVPRDEEGEEEAYNGVDLSSLRPAVEAFIDATRDDLELYLEARKDCGYDPAECFGHDLWLTQNHHGAGFWDRGLGELGRRLTDAAHSEGSVYLYVGDDRIVRAD